ncbi:holin [Lactococcus lactis subsp. lactis]|uniref:Holin n=1 Tax=Lactococcus lactis subsp. lactis TaxID=1360 RepID=A0A2Z3KLZ3_LACLL|nr:holin [Lactococcus lactis]AWN66945.1 holin [Lactococcus lactis subsp. lactis]
MEYQLLGVSGLILIILGLTWLKDGEKMDPPLRKRIIIDLTTIALFWIVFEFWHFSSSRAYENEVNWIINGSLAFFGARMIQLICQINPMFQELVNYLKSKNSKTDVIENESSEENK